MTRGATSRLHQPGCVVLATYKPSKELLIRQLRSIQQQSVSSYTCLITADGDPASTQLIVDEAVGGDDRFIVIGHTDRVGFFSNFERGLQAVPTRARWVALSDQDDYWYPSKLESLVPHLDTYSLVSGQARVVEHPSGAVITESTQRRNSTTECLVLDNQFTGAQLVFRRELLDVALPFPHLNTATEVHDHWLAFVARGLSGTLITDDVLQDYVQHGTNVIGEAHRGFSLRGALRTALGLTRRYEGNVSVGAIRRAVYKAGVGWPETMVEHRALRLVGATDDSLLARSFGSDRSAWRTAKRVLTLAKRHDISLRAAATYLAGSVAGSVGSLRRGLSERIAENVSALPERTSPSSI